MAECQRCPILGTGGRSILGHLTHGSFERNVKEISVQCVKVGVSIHKRCICMAKLSVCPQTVRSKEVFNLTCFIVCLSI